MIAIAPSPEYNPTGHQAFDDPLPERSRLGYWLVAFSFVFMVSLNAAASVEKGLRLIVRILRKTACGPEVTYLLASKEEREQMENKGDLALPPEESASALFIEALRYACSLLWMPLLYAFMQYLVLQIMAEEAAMPQEQMRDVFCRTAELERADGTCGLGLLPRPED